MKHILIVCMHFYPVQFRINDIALELVEKGYKVTVVTGIPNYPGAKFTKGYGWFKKRKENYKGIDIIRIPIWPRGKSGISLMLNYFSFNFFGYFFSILTRIKADHVFIYGTSPLIKAMVGLRYAKRRKIKSTLYVMDLWPESVQYAGGINNKFVLNYLDRKMKKIYSLSTNILTSSNAFIDAISKRGVPKDKLIYWPQAAEEIFIHTNDVKYKLETFDDSRLNLVFAGTIAVSQGLDILPKTAVLLKKENIPIRFIIIGDGREKDKLIQHTKDLLVEDYFKFVDRKPVEEIPHYFKMADGAILTLKDTPIFSMTIPAKLQSYMSFGLPILASATGEVKQIITDASSGYVSHPENIDQFVEIVRKFYYLSAENRRKMGINAKQYAHAHFNREKLMNQLKTIINS